MALALPARLILHASNRGAEGWEAVLNAVTLTGLVNGSDVRKTGVWRGMDVPWCLLFAKNSKPTSNAGFHYACPIYDRSWNQAGRYRIDYQTLHSLPVERVLKLPWLLKTLHVGTWRDVEIVEQLLKVFQSTLEVIWKNWNPGEEKTGLGYNRSPDSDQTEVNWLGKLKVFEAPVDGAFAIEHNNLDTYKKTWGNSKAHRARTIELYQPPLVIVPESPEATRRTPRGFKSDKTLAFSVSYYGYSCKGHPEAEALAALIYLLPHSLFFDYFLLMTSARFGADRQTFKKEEFDAIPFPDVTTLPKEAKATIERLALELEHNPAETKPWEQIDEFFFNLYQIEPRDAQVMRDTLFSAAPYRTAGKAAFAPVTFEEDKDYCTRTKFAGHLETMLQPFFGISGYKVAVTVKPNGLEQRPQFDVWGFIAIHRDDQPAHLDADLLSKITLEADAHGASRVIIRLPGQRGLLLGLLNEQRWWTQTRASFCAQRIVRDYLDAFDLRE
jgi:hypothetical protein